MTFEWFSDDKGLPLNPTTDIGRVTSTVGIQKIAPSLVEPGSYYTCNTKCTYIVHCIRKEE